MDISINTIHHILLDAALPSTLENLKNPTEEYIVNLLTSFLSRFCIDVNLIDQPISEQHTAMMYYEDSDVINLINLYAVVTQIFINIFIHDFCLIDITNPGQKRLRRQAKFLSNFVLYTMHKKSDLNDRLDQIQATYERLQELKEKKAQILGCINNQALHKAEQLTLIKKLESDIEHTRSKIENNNKEELELEAVKIDVQKEDQKVKDTCGAIKIKAATLSKTIAELQLEIVHSPGKYELDLTELKKQNDLKEEGRNTMMEAIQDKKQSIKQTEEKLNFILSLNNKVVILRDTSKDLKEKKMQLDNIRKEVDSSNNTRNELQTKLTIHKDQLETEKNGLHSEKDIIIFNLYNQLMSEKKAQQSKLKTNDVLLNERYLIKNKLQADIRKKEEDIIAFLHACQEAYNHEIANESELRKIWREE